MKKSKSIMKYEKSRGICAQFVSGGKVMKMIWKFIFSIVLVCAIYFNYSLYQELKLEIHQSDTSMINYRKEMHIATSKINNFSINYIENTIGFLDSYLKIISNRLDKSYDKLLANFVTEYSNVPADIAQAYLVTANNNLKNHDFYSALYYVSLSMSVYNSSQAQNLFDKIRNNSEELKKYSLFLTKLRGTAGDKNLEEVDLDQAFQIKKQLISNLKQNVTKQIPIVLMCNETYSKFMLTLLASLVLNSKLDTHLKIYLVHEDEQFSEGVLNKLKKISSIGNVELIYVPFEKEILSNHLVNNHNATIYYPLFVYYKLYLSNLVPEERFIYLDVDALTFIDLGELYDKEIDNYMVAAVADPPQFSRLFDRGVKFADFYFNSGVLLMNAARIRENNVIGSIDKFLENLEPEFFSFGDQDIFNILYGNQVLYQILLLTGQIVCGTN